MEATPVSPEDPSKQTNAQSESPVIAAETPIYTLYRWRFPGVFGLVILNVVAGMIWPWFGSISLQSADEFHISISQVNWLGNVVNIMFIPSSLATPFLCKRYGIRTCCVGGGVCLVTAAWVRYAGTAKMLSPGGAYSLLLIGQVIGGLAQPVFQIMGPRFSEAWFDFNGRTTATMIISVANPVGAALGSFIPSVCPNTRTSMLVLGIISTAAFPVALLVYSKPPTPPTFSGGLPPPFPLSTIRSLLNCPRSGDRVFPLRDRLDFFIILSAFSVLVAAANALSILTAQTFEPFGYSQTVSGLFAAVLILSGLLAALITAPLFDRVFTRHITITIKTVTPLVAAGWLSLIWAIRAHNAAAIFAVVAIIGVGSLTLLPLTLEVECEFSRDAETSAAILWCCANLLSFVFVIVADAVTAKANASPPFNMRNSSIFVAVFACVAAVFVVLGFRGLPDTRRAMDAARQTEEMEATKTVPADEKSHKL